MFTGIIEEVGQLNSISNDSITIKCSKILEDINVGDSIAVNGICLTVTNYSSREFSADVSMETHKVTNFSDLQSGDLINLERAMPNNGRFGGHIVSGHIDCVAKVKSMNKLDKFYDLEIELPDSSYSKYFVKKGSITINGISLTIYDLTDKTVKIAIIPHTVEETNLKTLSKQDNVNIEFDILAKYVEKNLLLDDNKNNITQDFLIENGFV